MERVIAEATPPERDMKVLRTERERRGGFREGEVGLEGEIILTSALVGLTDYDRYRLSGWNALS